MASDGRASPLWLQVRRIVVQTLLAARPTLQSADDDYYAFQLLGYDFVIDCDLRVWLCEVNASPAVASALLPGLVHALIRRAIDPICVPDVSPEDVRPREGEADEASRARRGEDFECIMAGPQ
jgi:hypothetical protein